MHHLDSDKRLGENAILALHKDTNYCYKQILEEVLYKTAVVWSLTPHHANNTGNTETFSYGLQHMNTPLLNFGKIVGAMANRDRWCVRERERERVKGICAVDRL